VAYVQDDAGNIKPSKRRSGEKIDPVVALIMAIGVAFGTMDETVVTGADAAMVI